jgi:hypothetical protein
VSFTVFSLVFDRNQCDRRHASQDLASEESSAVAFAHACRWATVGPVATIAASSAATRSLGSSRILVVAID